MWRVGFALLLPPMLVLAEQSATYALVTPLCAKQAGGWLNAVTLLFVIAVAALVFVAWRATKKLRQEPLPADTDRHGPNRLFLAQLALGSGLLSLLALLALWVPQWVLSPCAS